MRYLIYSDARTGSNGLLKLLSNTFDCKVFNEPLSDGKLNTAYSYLDKLYSLEISVSKSIIGELVNFININKNTDIQSKLLDDIKTYIKNNPIPKGAIVKWELDFYKSFLKFDKIIVLGRSNIIHSSISKLVQWRLSKEEINMKNEGGIIHYTVDDIELVKKYKESDLDSIIKESYDRWYHCFISADKMDDVVYISYEGLYYKMDDSIQKLKNFLSIDSFKDDSFINPKNRNKK